MKELYNGYRFSPDSDISVFNASMCLYYLGCLRENDQEPLQVLDPSVSTDLSKIYGILRLGEPEVIEDIVMRAIRKEPIDFSGSPNVLNLQESPVFNREKVLSTLFYMGFLTFAPQSPNLVVPNNSLMYFSATSGICLFWKQQQVLNMPADYLHLMQEMRAFLLSKLPRHYRQDLGKTPVCIFVNATFKQLFSW